ncbi:MAG: hypothetical protein ABIW18_01355 [Sphingomicrobium sp.]
MNRNHVPILDNLVEERGHSEQPQDRSLDPRRRQDSSREIVQGQPINPSNAKQDGVEIAEVLDMVADECLRPGQELSTEDDYGLATFLKARTIGVGPVVGTVLYPVSSVLFGCRFSS